ncbi:hypothetical protein RhiirB3_454207 [Rhizophagus irregularis]|nr:hypothetical protein RhiirB3_454207 [Rhizophagus irregularis]
MSTSWMILNDKEEIPYDLYGDVKCRICLEENEDGDHLIYCQQFRDKWLMGFFIHDITGSNQELPISFIHLILRNFFPKKRYRKPKFIVKSEKVTLTIITLFLEIFINKFYRIIWQSHCKMGS